MATYAIDSNKQQLRATGLVMPAPVWEQTADGKRRPSDAQDRAENGQPLWLIEVMYASEMFGRQQTVTANVLVPSQAQPAITAFDVVPFVGLTVNVYANRNGGGVRESWAAEGIATPQRRGE